MYYVFIACIGLTLIITQSKIFAPIRNFIESKNEKLGELINCSMCTGFWVGLLMGAFYSYDIFVISFGSSLFSWLVSIVGNLLITLSYYIDSLYEDDYES